MPPHGADHDSGPLVDWWLLKGGSPMKFDLLQELVDRVQRSGILCLVRYIRGNETATVMGGVSIDHDQMMLVVDAFLWWHHIPVHDVREIEPRPNVGRR